MNLTLVSLRRVRASILLCLCAGLQAACDRQPAPGATDVDLDDSPPPATHSSLDLRVAPFADFYFLARAQAAEVVPATSEFAGIVEAWQPVQQEIGTFGGFWRFDLAGLLSSTPEEFGEWFTDAPETVPSRRGGEIPIRGPGLKMSEAMRSAWPGFREQLWPQRQRELEQVVARLESEFLPWHRDALGYMLESLGIEDPEIEVPTYLALDTHPPGASTYRSRSGPVAILSTHDLLAEGRFSDLEETLLHETCHALDGVSDGSTDVFSRLRSALEQRGIDGSQPAYHDVPHLVMFVQAEETMRRLHDADHVAYGDQPRGDIAPLYQRSGPIAEVIREVWRAHLDGSFGLDEAVQRIVAEV